MTRQNQHARLNPKSVPSAGMRGGLGRTLLTAFLILGIVPLSIISFVAATQARHNIQGELRAKLATVAELTNSQIQGWITSQQQILTILSNGLAQEIKTDSEILNHLNAAAASSNGDQTPAPAPSQLLHEMSRISADNSAFLAWFLMNKDGHLLAADPLVPTGWSYADVSQNDIVLLEADNPAVQALATSLDRQLDAVFVLQQPIRESDLKLLAVIDPGHLAQIVDASVRESEAMEIYVVPPSGQALKLHANAAEPDSDRPDGSPVDGPRRHNLAVDAALTGQSGVASYENDQGDPVIGAYRWLSELNVAMVVEQAQASAFSASDDLAVVLIGVTLAAVLLTALTATAVTRRITLPIIAMTATAVQIAAGDLNQKVPATRRDEIGILARAFNVMTTKLRLLYEDLEHKVRERTKQLENANAEVRYQAMLLAISAEVGRVVTSILDRERLLSRVVELIRDCFQAYFVAIYFIDEQSEWAVLQEATGGLGAQLKHAGYRVNLQQEQLISQAVHSLTPQMAVGATLARQIDRQRFSHTRAELAIPLKIGERIIGVLDVHSTHRDAFEGNEVMVLETLSGQVVVAIENARAYEMEHRALEQLRELEELRRTFLANMSRELRMPLNNIIGFSRVILKEIDGPITDLQREDLTAIYDSGQHLLVLINDILDIAQIEAGAMELSMQSVDFGEISRSVIPTANALLEGRPVEFLFDISADLPPVMADPNRLRQVLIKLLSNAAKFTPQGEIALNVWHDNGDVIATISDTGIGIADHDRDKIFEVFRQGTQPVQGDSRGAGLGLTFSKEIVELHGGTLWLESQEGQGTTFTITLPKAETKSVSHTKMGE